MGISTEIQNQFQVLIPQSSPRWKHPQFKLISHRTGSETAIARACNHCHSKIAAIDPCSFMVCGWYTTHSPNDIPTHPPGSRDGCPTKNHRLIRLPPVERASRLSTFLNRKERKERKENPFVRDTQKVLCDVFAFLAVLAVQLSAQFSTARPWLLREAALLDLI